MKVLFVISTLGRGGAERVLSEIANHLCSIGCEVSIMTLADPLAIDSYFLNPNIRRMRLDIIFNTSSLLKKLLQNYKILGYIKASIKKSDPDVVVSFINFTNIRVCAALLFSSIKIIVSERVDPREFNIGWLWSAARYLLYKRANFLVVQTTAAREWALNVTSEKKVAVIPNSVRVIGDSQQSQIVSSQIPEDFIMAAGRLDPQKGFDTLLRAFAVSDLEKQGCKLVILGAGDERKNLINLSKRLRIENSTILPGVRSDIHIWMEKCKLFVLSSRFEGFPNVLIEAMAQGAAVVSTDCKSGPSEIIENDISGLLVKVDDVEGLSLAMKRLYFDDNLRFYFKKNAIKINEKLDPARVIKAWHDLIIY